MRSLTNGNQKKTPENTVNETKFCSYPGNNFAENPRKFLGIFPRNSRKFPRIRWKCRQKFGVISRTPFLGISCIPLRRISRSPFWCISRNPFQGISHNPFWEIAHKSFWGISLNQYQGISLKNNLRKCRPNLGKFLEISREKFFITNSWDFPGNYFQDFLKSFSEISWDILSIFLSKFTNH